MHLCRIVVFFVSKAAEGLAESDMGEASLTNLAENFSSDPAKNSSGYVRVVSWSELKITPVPEYVYQLLLVYSIIVSSTAVLFNTLAFLTFWKAPKLRIPINYLLMNLSAIDLLCGLFGGIPPILANAARGFFMGQLVCVIEGAAVGVLGIAHLSSLGVLAVSRYITICKPCGMVFAGNHALAGIVATWVWSLAWNLPPLTWGGYDLEGIGTYCGPSWIERSVTTRTYFFLYFIFCFILPFLLMCTSHCVIMKYVLKVSSSVATQQAHNRYDDALKKAMVWMMVAVLVCWTPYAILALYVGFVPDAKVNQYGASLPALFAKSSFILNPVIYFLLNKQFRDSLLRMICPPKRNPSSQGSSRKS